MPNSASMTMSPPGVPGCDGRERAVLGRIPHALLAIELRRGPGRGDAEGVDADDLLRLRVVDEGLRLAAPSERVPHGGHRAEHGARGIDGVAALLEDHGAGGRPERLAGDGYPMPAVQRWLDRPLGGGDLSGHEQQGDRQRQDSTVRCSVRLTGEPPKGGVYSSISISRRSSADGRRCGCRSRNRAQAFHRSRASSLPDGRSHSARSK